MATYQEQITRLKQQKARRDVAEVAFDRMCASIADVLMPYIEDKTLTQDQAAELMTKIVKAVLSIASHGDNDR